MTHEVRFHQKDPITKKQVVRTIFYPRSPTLARVFIDAESLSYGGRVNKIVWAGMELEAIRDKQ